MKNEKKLSPSQQKVLDFVSSQSNNSTTMRTLTDMFHRTTLKNLFETGVLITETQSRLRQDDMEMVYWVEVRVPTATDKIKELIKA